MGKRKSHGQPTLFIPTSKLPLSAAHPFNAKLNEVLAASKFNEFVEGLCAQFYEEKIGRPSLEPGKYFRLLLIGYFEGDRLRTRHRPALLRFVVAAFVRGIRLG